MNIGDLYYNLKGFQTVGNIMKTLNTSRQMAIYYVHKLRKAGYVKTVRGNKMRAYWISARYRLNCDSYESALNRNSPVKLIETKRFRYGKISPEEAVVYAIESKDIRKLITAIGSFRKIHEWNKLYRIAKDHDVLREVGALYDVARQTIRTRRMSRQFLRYALPKTPDFRNIVPKMKSKDFGNIEKKWRVWIPLNKADLEEYRW